jgi:hypothetical protein
MLSERMVLQTDDWAGVRVHESCSLPCRFWGLHIEPVVRRRRLNRPFRPPDEVYGHWVRLGGKLDVAIRLGPSHFGEKTDMGGW